MDIYIFLLEGLTHLWYSSDMFTIIIFIFLVAILVSLGSALFYLVGKKGSSEKMVKALTIRITLSLTLFILLILAFAFGWITPHSLLS